MYNLTAASLSYLLRISINSIACQLLFRIRAFCYSDYFDSCPVFFVSESCLIFTFLYHSLVASEWRRVVEMLIKIQKDFKTFRLVVILSTIEF